jgi:photosystem II CP47 chlorophyll apoprotein
MWRQGMFIIPFTSRSGITNSWGWLEYFRRSYNESGYLELWRCGWCAYCVFWPVFLGRAIWHWVYQDLEIFCDERTEKPSLDLPRIFGIHLFLAGWLVFCFGAFYVTGLYDPGIWVSDLYGLKWKSTRYKSSEDFDPLGLNVYQQEIYWRVSDGLAKKS